MEVKQSYPGVEVPVLEGPGNMNPDSAGKMEAGTLLEWSMVLMADVR